MPILNISLDQAQGTPAYRQIAEQVRHLVAAGKLKSGQRLPATRRLAEQLGLNPNTVGRAYQELEKDKVVTARRGGGTVVMAPADDPNLLLKREQRIAGIVGGSIVEALSSGYSIEELNAAFHLQLARWREEKRGAEALPVPPCEADAAPGVIRVAGSHDLALEILLDEVKGRHHGISIEVTHSGSMGGLIALKEGRAHLAGIHLLDEDTGEYNNSYVKHIFPGQRMATVHLAYRVQGLMFAAGNPKGISGIENLSRRDVVFINRQEGSGTRILLDFELKRRGIAAGDIRGYANEQNTHLAVARAIANGIADTGLGIQAAARSYGLGFLPLFRERYDLVTFDDIYRSPRLTPLRGIITSRAFKNAVSRAGGYDVSETGTMMFP